MDLPLAAQKIASDRKKKVTDEDEQRTKSMAILEQVFTERPLRLGKVTWTREDLYDIRGHTGKCYTYSVNINLTLTLDQDLLLAARKVALERKTSVNGMVREYLKEVTDQQERRAKSRAVLQEFFDDPVNRLEGITWTREELHDRKL